MMLIESLSAREFRSYERLRVEIGPQLTAVVGDNGAGKTNLLEALYFGCVGRSCRTKVDNQTVRFGAETARVEVAGRESTGESHTLAVAIDRKTGKTYFADGARRDALDDVGWRPPVAVFMPDRLELVKGAPGVRRAHLDQFVAALWPLRRTTRLAYAQTLAQRNALLARGNASDAELDAWDAELARHGVALVSDRREAVAAVAERYGTTAAELGLGGEPSVRYRSALDEASESRMREQLAERRSSDRQRGFTTFGPHRDELVLGHDGREVRTYGSQGQQRLSLLALLLAECEAIAETTRRRPLILLDDVMSELDATRRERLTARVGGLGQCVITATEIDHIPGGAGAGAVIEVSGGDAHRR